MSKTIHLGLSTSAFRTVMGIDLFLRAHPSSVSQCPVAVNEADEAALERFARDVAAAMNEQPVIEYSELYHSLCWDNDKIIRICSEEAKYKFWSVHAVYGNYGDPSSPIKEIRDLALKGYKAAADTARALGAKIIVIHPGAEAEYDMPRKERSNLAVSTIGKAAEYAATYDLMIGIEPLPPELDIGSSLEETARIVDLIGGGPVGINFDVNHLFPAKDIPNLIREAGSMIKSFHLSDQDDSERHWMPGKGKLDWKAIFDAMGDIGYDNPVIYESHDPDCPTYSENTKAVADNFVSLTESCGYNHI